MRLRGWRSILPRVDGLRRVLATQYGRRAARLAPVGRGHTNESYFVTAGEARWVARRSWPGKPSAQLERERTVLGWLAERAPGLPVPRLVNPEAPISPVAVRANEPSVQVFERLPGEPSLSWRGPASNGQIRSALALLGRLHAALAALPCAPDADPLDLVARRLARVAAVARTSHAEPTPETQAICTRIAAILDDARASLGPGARWVHGDFHLENLLFAGEEVTGLVDFDDVGLAASEVDVAFALLAVSRDGAREIASCTTPNASPSGATPIARRAACPIALDAGTDWVRLFCAHQVLIHLEAAQRGLWQLEPGIGFHPCLREVLR